MVNNAPRNLTDRQLKAISEKGGVVGLNAFSDFVADSVGNRDIDHVGFGFDFDDYLEGDTLSAFAEGDAKTIGFEDITHVPKLLEILENKGYSKEDIEKIKYKNFFRIIKEILK